MAIFTSTGDAHRDVKHLLRDLIEPSKSAASADFH